MKERKARRTGREPGELRRNPGEDKVTDPLAPGGKIPEESMRMNEVKENKSL